jgi:PAS domain S-box-containing protein
MSGLAKARFRELADAAPVMLWLADLTSECEFFNQRWLDFTGRTMEQELGVGWAEGVHFEDFQQAMSIYLEAFAARRAFRTEYRLRRHDGVFRWILETGHPRVEDGGAFLGFVGSCIDITDFRGAQEMQRRLDADLERRALPEMTIVDPLVVVGTRDGAGSSPLAPAHSPTPDPSQQNDWVLTSLLELQQAKEALRTSQTRYRTLSRHLLEIQERERSQLARELHDQFGQSLICVSLNLRAIKDELSPASHAPVPESLELIEQLLEQVRSLAFELRPAALDDLGLVAALRGLVARHGERTGVRASFIGAPADLQVTAEIETASFRIVQEALTNVARHAGAAQVEVTLAVQGDALEVSVRDDGVGFDVDERRDGLGLVGMSERAALAGGQLEIESAPGAGTTLRARFLLPGPAAASSPKTAGTS